MGNNILKAQIKHPAQMPNRAAPTRAAREITSIELFGDAGYLRIHHAGEVYTLRHTRKGRLILTK